MIDLPAADDTALVARIAKLPPATFMGRDCAELAEKYRQVRGISLGLPGERPLEAAAESSDRVEPEAAAETSGTVETAAEGTDVILKQPAGSPEA